jgi:protein phosphatase
LFARPRRPISIARSGPPIFDPPRSSLRLASESVQGRRPYNEDSFLTLTLPDGRLLLAVADGMGGHAAGEVASALAIQVLREAVAAGKDLESAVTLANERVHQMARSEPGKHGMGTTLVTVLSDGEHFHVANVGDSRAYLVTSHGVRQLTEDHSFLAEAMRRGQSEEEARSSPWKDALTRSIGTNDDVEVDVFGPFPIEGDLALVICSDGLYKTLGNEELRSLFADSTDAHDAAKRLVAAAYDAGSDDNITVVVAESGRVPRDDAAGEGTPARTLKMEEPFQTPEEREAARPAAALPPTPARWKAMTIIAAALVIGAAVMVLIRRL